METSNSTTSATMPIVSSLSKRIKEDVESLIKEYGTGRDGLMPILQEMNYKYGWLSDQIIMEIATAFDMSATEIYGVATFYHFLRTKPVGKYVISICQTISCDMSGKSKIVKVLENELGIKVGETSHDGMFTLEYTSCIGMCDESPAMLVNEKVYSKLTPEKVIRILKEIKGK